MNRFQRLIPAALRRSALVVVGSGIMLHPLRAQTPPSGPSAAAGPPVGQQPAASPPSAASQPWMLHTQATWIDQEHPAFNSPYEGANSLTSQSEAERTFSFSLYMGYRVQPGTEIYFDPEVFQGHGLSNTLGIAGFPNGEAVKAAFTNLHYNTSRLFIRQTFGLGGGTEKVDDGEQNVAGTYDVNRITLTLGKFAAEDLFDDNAYSHDSRVQFMNWALWESAAWDVPSDTVGFPAGFVAEWKTKNWTLRYGIFMEPTMVNGARLDYHVLEAHGQILEFDHGYSAGDLAGTLRPFVYWNQARMGELFGRGGQSGHRRRAVSVARLPLQGRPWDELGPAADPGSWRLHSAELGRRPHGVVCVHRDRPVDGRGPQHERRSLGPEG